MFLASCVVDTSLPESSFVVELGYLISDRYGIKSTAAACLSAPRADGAPALQHPSP